MRCLTIRKKTFLASLTSITSMFFESWKWLFFYRTIFDHWCYFIWNDSKDFRCLLWHSFEEPWHQSTASGGLFARSCFEKAATSGVFRSGFLGGHLLQKNNCKPFQSLDVWSTTDCLNDKPNKRNYSHFVKLIYISICSMLTF